MTRFIAALALCAAVAATMPASGAAEGLLAVGTAAPAFSVKTANGTFDTSATTKPYLLEFFAVWCPHCQREVAVLDRIEAADSGRISVIALPASPYGFDQTTFLDASTLSAFASRFHATYPIAEDPFFTIAAAYGAATFPVFYLVDATRHIAAVETGEAGYDRLQTDIDRLIAGS